MTARSSTRTAAARDSDELRFVHLDRQRALRAFDIGVLTTFGVAVAYGLLHYPVGLQWGLIAVGIAGGWLIGTQITRAVWGGHPHPRSTELKAWAALLGLVAWFVGAFVAYFMSQLLLEGASEPLLERLSAAGYSDYLTQTYDTYHAVAMAAMVVMAWRTTR